ncbi:type III secretion system stator protein SctL [Erwiniaceae bacterium BAC15a-03b]|uniref:Type III secretion system stator protein SctL n=1 Tax=Winslowiella arboricola TaxID=2978220 RepID=A0A9J6PRX5_9GAMM|nr:type III secretion system stator protein SctL [Winslowiella arboricola]MCU5773688.1 type III secretion system stator protein SctL [Winslowiella arboricola]MCU5778413.1 type III secretion system stator protein SctL [Winslowiella arboricola]
MWKVKKISLLNGEQATGNLLRAEEIATHQQAEMILAEAQQQAQEILAAAQQQAEQHIAEQREQCEAQFWQQADELFSSWQQQRQQDEQQLVTLAEQLLTQAITQVLDDFTPQQRFRALLQQLLRQHARQQQATLWCATAQQQEVSAWLAQQPQLEWQLSFDEQLPVDQLRLVTDQGELQIGWAALCQQLAAQPG